MLLLNTNLKDDGKLLKIVRFLSFLLPGLHLRLELLLLGLLLQSGSTVKLARCRIAVEIEEILPLTRFYDRAMKVFQRPIKWQAIQRPAGCVQGHFGCCGLCSCKSDYSVFGKIYSCYSLAIIQSDSN